MLVFVIKIYTCIEYSNLRWTNGMQSDLKPKIHFSLPKNYNNLESILINYNL